MWSCKAYLKKIKIKSIWIKSSHGWWKKVCGLYSHEAMWETNIHQNSGKGFVKFHDETYYLFIFGFHLDPSNHAQHVMHHVIPISRHLNVGNERVHTDWLPTQQESLEPWTSGEYPSLGFPAVVSGQCCLLLAPYAHTQSTHRCKHWKEGSPLSKNGSLSLNDFTFRLQPSWLPPSACFQRAGSPNQYCL